MGAPMARNHAASGADGLGVMITDGAQVQTALLGDDGAAAALPAQTAVVLMTTLGPPSSPRSCRGR